MDIAATAFACFALLGAVVLLVARTAPVATIGSSVASLAIAGLLVLLGFFLCAAITFVAALVAFVLLRAESSFADPRLRWRVFAVTLVFVALCVPIWGSIEGSASALAIWSMPTEAGETPSELSPIATRLFAAALGLFALGLSVAVAHRAVARIVLGSQLALHGVVLTIAAIALDRGAAGSFAVSLFGSVVIFAAAVFGIVGHLLRRRMQREFGTADALEANLLRS